MTFKPKTKKIEILSRHYPKRISELEKIFNAPTHIYIDLANVLGWEERLGWNVDLKRLKQFFDSFANIKSIKIYYGYLRGSQHSAEINNIIKKAKYEFITKPVKIIRLSIDSSSIPLNSPALLKDFVRKPLLDKLNEETIKFLNAKLRDLNKKGTRLLEDRKCNFDVEIGRDMLMDYSKDHINNFVLWSGDSDFEGPVRQLIKDRREVYVFATSRRVSVELSSTKARIFDIKKIKEFICWQRQLPEDVKKLIKSQKDPRRALKQ